MAYVADIGRNWSARRKAKSIDRSVDRAVAEVKAVQAAEKRERAEMVSRAKAAVNAMPASYFAGLGAKFDITAADAKARMLDMAVRAPKPTLTACTNDMNKLEAA